LVEVLAGVGKALSPTRRVRVQKDLGIALALARSEEVVAAIAAADEQLCPTEGELTGAGS
jgi:hypothetical protein